MRLYAGGEELIAAADRADLRVLVRGDAALRAKYGAAVLTGAERGLVQMLRRLPLLRLLERVTGLPLTVEELDGDMLRELWSGEWVFTIDADGERRPHEVAELAAGAARGVAYERRAGHWARAGAA